MDSFIVDEVDKLIELKKGDKNRLIQIKELCESNQLVPISERKYVERLASQYIHRFEKDKSKKPEKPKPVSVVDEPATQPEPKIEKVQAQKLEMPQVEEKKPEKPSKSFEISTTNKKFFGIGAIVLAVILIGITAVGTDGIQFPESQPPPINEPVPEFALETDETSYGSADIISISGHILSASSGTVRVAIENANGQEIWAENLSLKKNGEFSTLIIAGGSGWEQTGMYSVVAEYQEETKEISFDFTS